MLPGPALAETADLTAYLNARVADASGEVAAAAADYAAALKQTPANPLVAARAYRAALAAGDDALARRAATLLANQGIAPVDAALLPLADAAHAGDAKRADAAIATLSHGSLSVLVPALKGWTAFARGQDPLAIDRSQPGNLVARRLNAEADILLGIATGRDDGTQIATELSAAQAPSDVRIAAAQLLFAKDHDATARALLPASDPVSTALARGAPEKPTLGFGISRLLTRVAGDLGDKGPGDLVIAMTRASLIADPRYDRARLVLASALARSGASARAIDVLDAVDAKSAYADNAGVLKVAILSADGQDDAALGVARALAAAKTAGPDDWQVYADQLMANDRFDDAAPWYERVIDAGPANPWAAWLQYGSALDRAGQWNAARTALQKAVALAPDQPLVLNYLGYAMIEHDGDIAGATALLQKASALAPDDDSITDSLGWAYFRRGDPARGLPLLLKASMGEPANAEIGEHLGDVYWSLGRRFEARYAWHAAALTADPSDAIRLAAKIANGPPGAT